MDAMYDLGGKQGFGKVRYAKDARPFHEPCGRPWADPCRGASAAARTPRCSVVSRTMSLTTSGKAAMIAGKLLNDRPSARPFLTEIMPIGSERRRFGRPPTAAIAISRGPS